MTAVPTSDAMRDRYAVIGNPVAHSKSPQIHAEFARQTGQDIVYEALFAPPDGFRDAVRAFRAAGGKGLNVTLPFKGEAWQAADRREGFAARAAAVNTLVFTQGLATGHNTDGLGLVRDLCDNLGCVLRGKRILLLGAGGASRGVIEPLLREAPRQLVIANRTLAKAVDLVGRFEALQPLAQEGVIAYPYAELAGRRFDLVINATSASLGNVLPPLPEGVFAPDALAYDMVYGADTPFLRFAREQGAAATDGIGMLVEQAAESFCIWRGVRPATAPVIALMKQARR